jgi:acetolactate synthase-1/2/3 large subunit
MNVQREQIDREDVLPSENKVRPVLPLPENTLSELIDAITKSEKPLVLAGRGIRAAEKIDLFHKFIETVQVPVVTSLLGLDSISYEHPLRVGFLGAYGNRWVNMAIGESDLIIVLGSRLDIRQTGSDVGFFERNRTIFHVDCEEGELNNRLKSTIVVHADLNDFFPAVLA